jgi:hypothetical protein
MEQYLWAFYALASAFFVSLIMLFSERYNQSGIGFLAVIRLGSALTMLPFMFFVEWPKETLFYIYGALAYVLFSMSDVFIFRVSASYGAGVLSRWMPLTAIISFLIWLSIDDDTLKHYIENPLIALGIIASLCAIVFCMSCLRACEVSIAAFKVVLPALVLIPFGGVLTKLAFDLTELSSATLVILFVGSFFGLATYSVLYRFIPSVKQSFNMNAVTIKIGIICSLFSTLLIYTANLSFDLVSNPAYATAVSFTSAIWILLIYKLIGKQDSARVLPGLGIVIFTALLVILSGL